MSSGIEVEKSDYNDLLTKVNETAETIFVRPETRPSDKAEFFQALDRLVPMVQEGMIHPGSQTKLPGYAEFLITNPAAAQQLKKMLANQLRLYQVFRLALDETNAAQSYQADLAKGGLPAAQAALNRAAAGWLDAGQDPLAQNTAFEQLRAANSASSQKIYWQLWTDLLHYNPPVSAAVGTPLLAYLQPFFNTPEAVRMFTYHKIPVKHMELEGKPLTLGGTLVSGAHFSTAAWKGSVILIDGWSPAFSKEVADLSRVQTLLAQHHAQGLEVLGIAYAAYGQTPDAVKAVLAGHPDLTFPQLYDPSHPDIDKLCSGATTFGLRGETFGPERLIDRNGLLHYVNRDENLEGVIVKFLAEDPPKLAEAKDAR